MTPSMTAGPGAGNASPRLGCMTERTVGDIVAALEEAYPPNLAESWDAVGLICGDPAEKVSKVAFALDCTQAVADRAVELGADLIVALDTRHVSELVARGVPEDRIRLLRSFDPASPSGAGVEDPYYGGPEGFTVTRQQIEAAADGILDWVRERVE